MGCADVHWIGRLESLRGKGPLMKLRVASLLVVCVFVSGPVFAQGPSGGGKGGAKDLSADLAALAARVSKLEGNIVAADLAGTYSFMVIDTSMGGAHNGEAANILTRATRATATLNADGTGSASNVTCEGSMLNLASGALTDAGDPSCGDGDAGVTWTYADGVLTITFLDDGDQIPFNVAAGGRLLIVGGAFFHASDPSSNALLFIATRLR
jgi:hypothetical protein